MKYRNFYLIVSVSFLSYFFNSCNKINFTDVNKKEQPTVNKPPQEALGGTNLTKTENSCIYSTYLNKIQNIDTNSSSPSTSKYVAAEKFFKLMEDHEFNITKNTGDKVNPISCTDQCSDLNLNKIYESLIAYEIITNTEMNQELSKVTNKIMQAMKAKLGNSTFESSVKFWSEKIKDDKISYPSFQRKLVLDEFTFPVVGLDKTSKLKYLIGLPIVKDGKNYINPAPNVGLAFDFLATNAKKHDKKKDIDGYKGTISSIKEGETYIVERDYYFNAIGRRLRGYRGNLPSMQQTTTDQFGISPIEVAQLKAPKNSIKWTDQRTHCLTEPKANLYSNSIDSLQIPLACGISGSTNIAITPIFVYNVNFDEDEMRKYLLLTWAVLSYDTGHSLQEVLTSPKLTSIYFTGVSKSSNPLFHEFKPLVSIKALDSLQRATKLVSPLTEIDRTVLPDLKKWDDIENKIFGTNPKNPTMHFYNEIESSEEKKSFQQTPDDKEIRSELEYYFSRYDQVKIVKYNSVFGKYNASFFSQLKSPIFEKVRKAAQKKLVEGYFNLACKAK